MSKSRPHIARVVVPLVLALAVPTSQASGMKMGFGGAGLNLFPYGLFPEFTGPLTIGGGYAIGTADGDRAPYLRFGLTMIKFEGIEPLGRPRGMLQLDYIVHFADNTATTVSAAYQHGVGRLLVGGGLGISTLYVGEHTTHRGLVLVPEISLPLRGRMGDMFTPALVAYARGEIAASGRDVTGDRIMLGVSLVLP